MDFKDFVIEKLIAITNAVNEIGTKSRRTDELPVATSGNKLVAVFNLSNNKTEKENLTTLLLNLSDQDNINIIYDLPTLAIDNESGFVDYINNLASPFLEITPKQSSVRFKILDSGNIYQIIGTGKGIYGAGNFQLFLENVNKTSPNTNTPPPFGTFHWIMRGTDHNSPTPIAGDIFEGVISQLGDPIELSSSLIWNGTGPHNNTNLANFEIRQLT